MAFVHTTRRGFLLGAGATLLALPFVQLLGRRGARGDVPRGADRVLFFYYPHGKFDPYWDVDGTSDRFSLRKGSIIESLAPFADKCLFLRGIEFKDADNHNGGMRAMLRAGGDANTVGAGASIDWYLADRIGRAARFPWLGLGAIPEGGWGTDFGTCPFYKAPFVFNPTEKSPQAAWTRLFGDLARDPVVEHRNRRRQGVIARVRGDLSALRARLGTEERHKLDQHVAAIDQLEHRLQTGAVPGCVPGTLPGFTDVDDNGEFPTLVRQQIDVAVAALSCGLTRVACLQLSHTASPLVMSWAPIKTASDHHALSHSEPNDAAGIATFVACQRFFLEQFAYLLGRMDGTPDPVRGGTLLDTTTVVLVTEMGDPQVHHCTDVPMVIAGGGGYFKTGRYLDTRGAPHQQLLVSLCHSLGLDNDTFARPEYGKGELPGIAA